MTKKQKVIPLSPTDPGPLWKELCTLPVAGLQYYDYNAKEVARGKQVLLYHEPSNKYDARAIKIVLKDGHRMLGHVPRSLTGPIHQAKAEGCKFYCFVNQHFPGSDHTNMVWIKVKVLKPANQHIPQGTILIG